MIREAKIGVTLGDPCGIGPEIAAASIAREPGPRQRRIVVFGDRAVWERAAGERSADVELFDVEAISSARVDRDARPGKPGPRAAQAQVRYLEAAAEAARTGEIDALVTAPIHKQNARAAGFSFPGHTEFLAERLGAARVAMMFAGPRLKVALATVHEPLAAVPRELTREAVEGTAELLARALARDFGVKRPRVGILGLNPHAGEGGDIGREEIDVVAPAVEELKNRLGDLASFRGPLVPDAAFRGALADPARGAPPPEDDALVALYHDQGLIPVKLIDFEESVNLTLGLPIPRTSPDHGVAYDIAGTGRARSASFRAALRLADEMAAARSGAVKTARAGSPRRR